MGKTVEFQHRCGHSSTIWGEDIPHIGATVGPIVSLGPCPVCETVSWLDKTIYFLPPIEADAGDDAIDRASAASYLRLQVIREIQERQAEINTDLLRAIELGRLSPEEAQRAVFYANAFFDTQKSHFMLTRGADLWISGGDRVLEEIRDIKVSKFLERDEDDEGL